MVSFSLAYPLERIKAKKSIKERTISKEKYPPAEKFILARKEYCSLINKRIVSDFSLEYISKKEKSRDFFVLSSHNTITL